MNTSNISCTAQQPFLPLEVEIPLLSSVQIPVLSSIPHSQPVLHWSFITPCAVPMEKASLSSQPVSNGQIWNWDLEIPLSFTARSSPYNPLKWSVNKPQQLLIFSWLLFYPPMDWFSSSKSFKFQMELAICCWTWIFQQDGIYLRERHGRLSLKFSNIVLYKNLILFGFDFSKFQ